MRKVKEKPVELTTKIQAKEGFDKCLDLKNGKLSNRYSVYSVPVKEIPTDRKGYKKLELVTGQIVYHNKATIPDKIAGRRIQNTVIIEGITLKFVAFHKTAVSRLMFDCRPALSELKEKMPKKVQRILNWTEWHAYRSTQKSLRVRHYKHDKFYSEHAKKIDGMAEPEVAVA